MAEFNDQLKHLVAALDPQEGWYAVFLQRDGEAIRSYIEGRDLPSWDVVAALLDDLQHKRGADERVRTRAQELHRAAVIAHDRRIGRAALLRLLKQTLIERDAAAAQLRGLYESRTGRDSRPQSPADLFQVRDRHERAAARCVELQDRLSSLDTDAVEEAPVAVAVPLGPASRRNVRIASAAFAAIAFGGVQAATAQAPVSEPLPQVPEQDPAAAAEARRVARLTAHRLANLRAQGLGGQAHIALLEAVAGPQDQTVALIEELEASGQVAEIPTLLWEAACLPSHRFAALAGALCDAGRESDARVLLRNGSAQPVNDVAAAVHALLNADRTRELDLLLGPLLRARPLQQAVRLADEDGSLVRVLLESAGRLSEQHQRDLAHALRAAGLGARMP